MEYEKIKDILIKKVEHEFYEYKQNLIKTHSLEEIINRSGETVIKEEICDIISYTILSKQEIKALLKTDKILNKLYDSYLETETNYLDPLKDGIDDGIKEITRKFEKEKEKVR